MILNNDIHPKWWKLIFAFLIATRCYGGEHDPVDPPTKHDAGAAEVASTIDAGMLGGEIEGSVTLVNDAMFLRRVTLDLAGRTPTIAEVREYLEDTSSSNRLRTIDRLMDSGAHVRTMATFWRRVWIPQADTNEFAFVADDFEAWLAVELQRGTPFDQLVSQVITWNPDSNQIDTIDPSGFYAANESKPENLASSATRAFLGINLDCAQCHDHPFAVWTRAQFWQTAAFFAEPPRSVDGTTRLPKLKIPDGEFEYSPALLTDSDVVWAEAMDTVALKSVLVDWMMTEKKNYLARNAVNRLWTHFFGEALVEPIDDLSVEPDQFDHRAELLETLAEVFVESQFDTALLVQAITQSDFYRLATSHKHTDSHKHSEQPVNHSTQSVPAMAHTRGMTAEQLYYSLRTAANLPPVGADDTNRRRADSRQDFVQAFQVERSHQAERSISQSLMLMNGSLANELSDKENNPMLAAVLASPFMSFDEQVDTVFIAVLGRHAQESECQAVLKHAESYSSGEHEQCLENLFWALINSPEFNTNH